MGNHAPSLAVASGSPPAPHRSSSTDHNPRGHAKGAAFIRFPSPAVCFPQPWRPPITPLRGHSPCQMALSSAAAARAACSLPRLTPSEPSRLSSSSSLRFPAAIGGPRGDRRRLCALPRRQLLPVVAWPIVEALNEQFSSFDELVKKSEKPILVDFYATWCGPCQYMVPVLDEVGATLGHKLQIVKIDTQKDRNIANQYKIEALPTFIIFRDGKQCDRFEGAMPMAQLIERIENALNTQNSV